MGKDFLSCYLFLAKNIYRTALPSKTATCLACQKPIIFCFDKKSKFGKWMETEAGCPVVGCDDAEALCEVIMKIKCHKYKNMTCKVFTKYFKKKKNSLIYTEVILNNT